MKKLELYLPDNIYNEVINSGINLQQEIMNILQSYKKNRELEKVDNIVNNFSTAYQEYLDKKNLKDAWEVLDEI